MHVKEANLKAELRSFSQDIPIKLKICVIECNGLVTRPSKFDVASLFYDQSARPEAFVEVPQQH